MSDEKVMELPANCPMISLPPSIETQDPHLISELEQYGRAHPDTYGGIWVTGDLVMVAFTEEVNTHQEALQELIDDSDNVRVAEVQWSLRSLRALHEAVAALEWPIAGANLEVNGVDVLANRYMIGVDRVTDAVRLELARRLPVDMICVTQSHGGTD